MQYQTFPGVNGSSQSLQKLEALRLPSLKDKKFLDVGCNEGFFCGYAHSDGAHQSIGIDSSKDAISRAQIRFSACQFLNQSWDVLPEGNFDVILLASAMHYASDQAALIHQLMDALTEDGTLVLEIGIAPSGKAEWVSIKRSIDQRLFPSHSMLAQVLKPYAWKTVGFSVMQAGDPIKRYVIHVKKPKPYVFLLMQTPGMGKTTLAQKLFSKPDMPVVEGDIIFTRVFQNKLVVSDELKKLICDGFSTHTIDKAIERVMSSELDEQLVELWCKQVKYADFVLDSYIPKMYQQQVIDIFLDKGYIPVTLDWNMDKSMSELSETKKRIKYFQQYLSEVNIKQTNKKISVLKKHSAELSSMLFDWCIDSPNDGQLMMEGQPLTFFGWALPNKVDMRLQCYTSSENQVQFFEFNIQRQDAIDSSTERGYAVTGASKTCGFKFTVMVGSENSEVEMGFVVDGQKYRYATLYFDEGSHIKQMGNKLRRQVKNIF